MTPDFALSLSFDGIRLLRRVNDGWHLVGEVALDVADLAADLAGLRAAALAIDPAPLRTKLLIPDDQIKYITIETAQTTLDDVHGALDGATPYHIDDLAIDFDRNGGRTFIAAVARETLAEAEGFAAQYDFGPVCFAAVPTPYTFQSEVFFGPTQAAKTLLAKGETVARDDESVKVTGIIAPPPEPEPEPEPAPVVLPEDVASAPVTFDDFSPAPPDVVFASRNRRPAPAAETQAPSVAPPAAQVDAPPPDAAPVPTADDFTPNVPFHDTNPGPLFTRRKDPPALAVPVGVTDGPPLGAAAAAPSAVAPHPAAGPVVSTAPDPMVAPPLTGLPKDSAPAPDNFANISAADPVEAVFEPDPAPDDPPYDQPDPVFEPEPEPVAAPAPVAPAPASTSKPKDPFEAKAAKNRKPRFFALKLTLGLLLFMFLIALWANTWSEDGIAGWFGGDDDTDVVEVAIIDTAPDALQPVPETPAATLPAPVVADIDMPAPSALTPEIDQIAPDTIAEAAPLPIVRAPAGRILTPAEADRIYAATGVWQRAPRLPLEPRAGSLDGLTTYATMPDARRLDRAELPDAALLAKEIPVPAPRNPPPAGTTFQRDLRGFILATADGITTPNGALVIAGPPPRIPPLRPGTALPAPAASATTDAADTADTLLAAGGTPAAPAAPDIAPDIAQDTADAPADAAPVTDATPPATDLIIVAGRPPRVPPLRPDSFASIAAEQAAAAPETTAPETTDPATSDPATDATAQVTQVTVNPTDLVTSGGVSLASFRPITRPGGLVPAPPPPVFADPALAAFRPALRPEGLAPAATPDPETPDLSAVVAAIAEAAAPSSFVNVTARAIQISPRPDTRPRNFDRVVSAARARIPAPAPTVTASAPAPAATTASRPTTAVSAAPARPTGPTAGSVAQAATMSNAIRLRDMNLIGVYGRPGDRRALVRTGNGRFVKVEIGSSLDGGKVTAIGDSALNYVKRGRTYAIQLPAS